MLSPFAPHTAEELWERLGHAAGCAHGGVAAFDAEVAKADEIVVPVQVNGKVRARMTVPADATEDELRETALADAVVARPRGRQDGQEGRRGAGASSSAWWWRDAIDAGSCSDCWRLVRGAQRRRAATRSRAAARSCRPTSRRSASRSSPTHAVFDVETVVHPGASGPSSSAAASTRSCCRRDRRRRAADGRDPRDHHRAGQLHRSGSRRRATSSTVTARIELRDMKTNKVLWENPRGCSARNTRRRPPPSALDPDAFFGQDANALDRVGTEFAAPSSARSSKRSKPDCGLQTTDFRNAGAEAPAYCPGLRPQTAVGRGFSPAERRASETADCNWGGPSGPPSEVQCPLSVPTPFVSRSPATPPIRSCSSSATTSTRRPRSQWRPATWSRRTFAPSTSSASTRPTSRSHRCRSSKRHARCRCSSPAAS